MKKEAEVAMGEDFRTKFDGKAFSLALKDALERTWNEEIEKVFENVEAFDTSSERVEIDDKNGLNEDFELEVSLDVDDYDDAVELIKGILDKEITGSYKIVSIDGGVIISINNEENPESVIETIATRIENKLGLEVEIELEDNDEENEEDNDENIDPEDENVDIEEEVVRNAVKAILEKKWVADVKTKWHPPEGLFTKDAETIAKVLKKESKDLKQAISRLNFYINRAGENLSKERMNELEKAKKLLKKMFEEE